MWVWFTFSPGRGASRSTWVVLKDAGQQKAGESWSRAAKERPNLNKESVSHNFCTKAIGWGPRSGAYWLMQLRCDWFQVEDLPKESQGIFPFQNETHMRLWAGSLLWYKWFYQERLCGLIWAAKLGVSTVIQWQDRSIGCITGKKKHHRMKKHFTWDPTYRDNYKGLRKQKESSIDKSPLKEDGQITCMHCKKLDSPL